MYPDKRCPARKGVFGLFRTHQFKPRFDITPPIAQVLKIALDANEDADDPVDIAHIVERMSKKTYVGDVCTHCGETVKIYRGNHEPQ